MSAADRLDEALDYGSDARGPLGPPATLLSERMRRFIEVRKVLDQCSYRPGWRFELHMDPLAGLWFQVVFEAEDTVRGGATIQHGREWRVPTGANTNDVVKAAMGAVLAAEEHEAKEHFRYKDAQIFHPHYDVEALVEASKARWV